MRFVAITAAMGLSLCLSAAAQPTSHWRVPVEESMFDHCDSIATLALHTGSRGDPAYSIELYPRYHGSPVFPFPSEITAQSSANWIAQRYRPQPFAMFYSINGRYLLKCRDTSGGIHEIAGPSGTPLDLGDGASILHFVFYGKVAHVYVVAKNELSAMNGHEMFGRVTKLLGGHSVLLYIRNDPWFYAYADDSTLFEFVDRSKAPSYEEYRQSQTLHCMTQWDCRLGRSWP